MDREYWKNEAYKYGKSYVKSQVTKYAKKKGRDALQYASNEAKSKWAMSKLPNPPSKKMKKILASDDAHDKAYHDEWMTKNASQSILPSQATMNNGDEVPVVPPPRKIAKIHPDYFTIKLPFNHRFESVDASSFVFNNTIPLLIVRLNSIYDPFKGVRAGALTDPNQEEDRQPAGRDLWAAHFKYYRVLSSHVSITFINNCITGQGVLPAYGSFLIGYELGDEDMTLSDRIESFRNTKRANRAFLDSAPTQYSWNGVALEGAPGGTSKQTVTYDYNPQTWTHHVEELASDERWTPIDEDPALDHDLIVRAFHNVGAVAATGLTR